MSKTKNRSDDIDYVFPSFDTVNLAELGLYQIFPSDECKLYSQPVILTYVAGRFYAPEDWSHIMPSMSLEEVINSCYDMKPYRN